MKSFVHCLLRAITLMLFGISATMTLAQGTSATLTGQVTDATGAVIPNATVSAKNTDTNLVQTRTTNASACNRQSSMAIQRRGSQVPSGVKISRPGNAIRPTRPAAVAAKLGV